MGFLAAFGQWLLKLLLGGLFGQINQQLEDEAQHSAEAGIQHAQSTEEATKTEVEILKAQQAEKERLEKLHGTDTDPFGSEDWNSKS